MAFKDVGARFMARILSHFIEGRDDEHPVTVLVATSATRRRRGQRVSRASRAST